MKIFSAIALGAVTLAGCQTSGAGMSSSGDVIRAKANGATGEVELAGGGFLCVGNFDIGPIGGTVVIDALCNGKPTQFIFNRPYGTKPDGTIFGKLPNGKTITAAVGAGRLSTMMTIR